MKFTVNQHNNTNVSLITDTGYVLGYFNSVDEALNICDQWYTSNSSELKHEVKVIPLPDTGSKLLNYFSFLS